MLPLPFKGYIKSLLLIYINSLMYMLQLSPRSVLTLYGLGYSYVTRCIGWIYSSSKILLKYGFSEIEIYLYRSKSKIGKKVATNLCS